MSIQISHSNQKEYNHVPPEDQAVQVGDIGGEDQDLTCVGYKVSTRPGPGFPYVQSFVWWSESEGAWKMSHPTDSWRDGINVPDDLEIKPDFE